MSVGRVYAKALFGSAKENGATGDVFDRIQTQLNTITATVKNSKELQTALFSPLTTAKEKVAVVQALAQQIAADPILAKFLLLLASKGRMAAIEEVGEEFSAARIASENGLQGRLVAAEAIGDADVAALSQAFSKKLGKKVSFQVSTDPSLLAGVKVTVNGVTYDGTLKSQLERLRDRMLSIGSSNT